MYVPQNELMDISRNVFMLSLKKGSCTQYGTRLTTAKSIPIAFRRYFKWRKN
jgi:hypothetical protein